MSFHGEDALNAKQMARIRHIYTTLADRERENAAAGQIVEKITYIDMLTISMMMNTFYGTSKSFDDKKAQSPLYSLQEINKVLKTMVDELDALVMNFKKTLQSSKQAKTLGLDPEPLYLAVHILSKMLFFVNEAIFHMCRVLPHAKGYDFWSVVKLALDRLYWEKIIRQNNTKRDS